MWGARGIEPRQRHYGRAVVCLALKLGAGRTADDSGPDPGPSRDDRTANPVAHKDGRRRNIGVMRVAARSEDVLHRDQQVRLGSPCCEVSPGLDRGRNLRAVVP